jgi:hypothetical protein
VASVSARISQRQKEADSGMSATGKNFFPSKPIGASDAPDSKVADGTRVSANTTTAGKATCVYANQEYGVGAKVCISGLIHQAGSNGQWFNLGWEC